MKIITIITACIATVSSYAGVNEVHINSGDVEFNGTQMILHGDVSFEHMLGNAKARHAILKREYSHHNSRFRMFYLSDDVSIAFHNGGAVFCDEAEIDCRDFWGLFRGGRDTQARYVERSYDKYGEAFDFVVEGKIMNVVLGKDDKNYTLETLSVYDEVKLEYGDAYTVSADEAFYKKYGDMPHCGYVTFSAHDRKSKKCYIKSSDGDNIQAKRVIIEDGGEYILFHDVAGCFSSEKLAFLDGSSLSFSSKKAVWDANNGVLSMHKNASIEQSSGMRIEAEGLIRIIRDDNPAAAHIVKDVQSEGRTTLVFGVEERQEITCSGGMHIDYQRLQAELYSDKDADEQVKFCDATGEIYGDNVVIHYTFVDEGLVPKEIFVTGNVRVVEKGEKSVTRFALADTLHISCFSREITLEAEEGNHVLFFDKDKDVKISAPAVLARRSSDNKIDTVQGLGAVRFVFSEKEQHRLKQSFQVDI
jgi:hypothetical protein